MAKNFSWRKYLKELWEETLSTKGKIAVFITLVSSPWLLLFLKGHYSFIDDEKIEKIIYILEICILIFSFFWANFKLWKKHKKRLHINCKILYCDNVHQTIILKDHQKKIYEYKIQINLKIINKNYKNITDYIDLDTIFLYIIQNGKIILERRLYISNDDKILPALESKIVNFYSGHIKEKDYYYFVKKDFKWEIAFKDAQGRHSYNIPLDKRKNVRVQINAS